MKTKSEYKDTDRFFTLLKTSPKKMHIDDIEYCIYYLHFNYIKIPGKFYCLFIELMEQYERRKVVPVETAEEQQAKHLKQVNEWYEENQKIIYNKKEK